MNKISPGTSHEIAVYFVDISKLTAIAAFIVPCFLRQSITEDAFMIMASVAFMSFVLGIIFYRITDHLEGDD